MNIYNNINRSHMVNKSMNTKMNARFTYLNEILVNSINAYNIGIIKPYQDNLIKNISKEHIPDYYYTGVTPKSTHINTLYLNDLIKIFDLNRTVKTIIDSIEHKFIHKGTDIADIDNFIYTEFCKNDIYPSVFGYEDFPKSSCISINNMICHCIPYSYKLKEGDIITVDVCGYNGFHTDMANTYIVSGKNQNKHKKLVDTNKECIDKAIEICKPGQLYSTIGTIVEKHANENGFKVLTSFSGHGIGKNLHMSPRVYNYNKKPDDNVEMKVGDMFTIEPLLTEGENVHKLLADNTSVVSADGKMTSHFERTILITENGHLILN